ncbi:MAG: hypothetical protein HXS53_04760 [Theionarchaea archaeon]|nr:hypothetical protein [Theionarchaea archaeon]
MNYIKPNHFIEEEGGKELVIALKDTMEPSRRKLLYELFGCRKFIEEIERSKIP